LFRPGGQVEIHGCDQFSQVRHITGQLGGHVPHPWRVAEKVDGDNGKIHEHHRKIIGNDGKTLEKHKK